MTAHQSLISILGAGNMGASICRGLLVASAEGLRVRATTSTEASAAALNGLGLEVRSLEFDSKANLWATDGADIVVLGVKPWSIIDLLSSIAPHLKTHVSVVSIAAGITIEQIEQFWGGAVFRAMPNIPVAVANGFIGLSAGKTVEVDQLNQALSLFEHIGKVMQVDESLLNALSSFSGSGPAFVYFFIERFVEAAKKMGFSTHQAEEMVQQTWVGAMRLLDSSNKTPERLRQEVTSKGGTTEAALSIYAQANLSDLITEASEAAIRRSEELAE